MADTIESSDKETNNRTRTSVSIAAWWNKFHFSGRVIMCSVLFGLGLVLIGGLVFAINMDDDTIKSNSDNLPEQLPPKAPSKYVGPAIMGIGGFIVTVGVIMCLFETQVCRKKTGDSSPLISDKTDPEGKESDAVAVSSSSLSHKNHKHGTRKACSSPRKSKNKHKSHSKDKSPQKSPSATSPPVSIEKSKSFMTSSEDQFLTPPNAMDTASIQSNTENAEDQSASSLMKSFNSSAPSWNQSTEFLTPSASFRDASISINSSIEVDEKQQHVNFKSTDPEYMTPLTVEEDRIQKLLIRVKNEQKEIAKREIEAKFSEMNTGSQNDAMKFSDNGSKAVKAETKMSEDADNKNIPTVDRSASFTDDELNVNNQPQNEALKNENKIKHAENTSVNECLDTVNAASYMETDKELLHNNSDINVPEKSSIQADTEKEESSECNPQISSVNKKQVLDHNPILETTEDENENDLENSVSSDETVVSPDSFTKKSENKEDEHSTWKENSCFSEHSKSESLDDTLPVTDSVDSNPQSFSVVDSKKDETHDFGKGENNSSLDKHNEILPADKYS